MIIFSFEVDTLEIALKEQQDMVDKIFLVESSATHKGVGNNIIGQPCTSPAKTHLEMKVKLSWIFFKKISRFTLFRKSSISLNF